ncbi:MAG: HDOD domain-containing protein [bacterium]|nr:HDOD domain-containing protein [bacterium]
MSSETFPFDQIPPLSLVVTNVIRFDPEDPGASIDALQQIIAPDKGISAELLKISNSALYGRSGRIKTLKEAVTLLGVKTVKNIVLLLTTKAMSGRLNLPIFHSYLREWPILSALVALDLCSPLRLRPLREEAFLAGLMHKIGMTVIALNRPQEYARLLSDFEASKGAGESIAAREQAAFGIDHPDVGAQVFEMWKMPPELRRVVGEHEFSAEQVAEQNDVLRVTALSGLVARDLMGLALTEDERAVMTAVPAYYEAPPEALAAFNEEYYLNLKEHPFLQENQAG